MFTAAVGLIYWHVHSWRTAQLADLSADEHDYYRRQFRRRMQTSAMLGILAVVIVSGEFLTRWANSLLFFGLYWVATLLLVIWIFLLACVDIWATQHHFSQLRQKYFIEQTKLQAEIHRIKSVRGNGKPFKEKSPEEGPVESDH
jgi:hypothetical protein